MTAEYHATLGSVIAYLFQIILFWYFDKFLGIQLSLSEVLIRGELTEMYVFPCYVKDRVNIKNYNSTF